MDPNAALERLRELMLIAISDKSAFEKAIYFEETVEVFDGLDHWIKRGGFLPDAWRRT